MAAKWLRPFLQQRKQKPGGENVWIIEMNTTQRAKKKKKKKKNIMQKEEWVILFIKAFERAVSNVELLYRV